MNGYKFHTLGHGSNKATMNSGVCIKGSNFSATELDFYGQLMEVLQFEYPALPLKRVILFNCQWFDPTPSMGTRSHPEYKLVDVNHTRRFNRYEPFILAEQAMQVYYASYPSTRKNMCNWWAVCKIKARGVVEVAETSKILLSNAGAFQEDVIENHYIDIAADKEPQSLVDHSCPFVEIDDIELEENEEVELEIESDEEYEELDDDDNNVTNIED